MKMHLLLYHTAAVWLMPIGVALSASEKFAQDTATTTAAAERTGAAPRATSTWFDRLRPGRFWDRPDDEGTERVASATEDREQVHPASAEFVGTLPPMGPQAEQILPSDETSSLPLYEEAYPIRRDGGGYFSATSMTNGKPYEWRLMPQGLIYRSYLAGEKESRLRSFWNQQKPGGNFWDLTLGGNVGILRYGTRGDVRPEGWQIGLEGAGIVRLDVDENRDVDADDFRGGIPITWGDSIHQVKFAYYHLSSHLGDEFLLKNPGFDRLNYSRDVLVWGHSIYPTDDFRVYGEIGYAFYTDVGEPWELQFGLDYAPGGRTGARGAPFAAVNAHLREEVNYGGNLVLQTGWAWRRSPASGLFRMGVEYYTGKDDQFSFFNDSVEKFGFGIWYDF